MRNLILPMALAVLSACAPPAPSSAQRAPHTSVSAPTDALPLEWLDEDLPSPSITLDLTRRAMTTLRTHDGFLPAITQVSACYDGLTSTSSREDRVYCLQLDAVAYLTERGAPADWQAADARYNDYFTTARFNARQTQFAPPADAAPSATQRKAAVIAALASVAHQVMAEEVARLQTRHAQ